MKQVLTAALLVIMTAFGLTSTAQAEINGPITGNAAKFIAAQEGAFKNKPSGIYGVNFYVVIDGELHQWKLKDLQRDAFAYAKEHGVRLKDGFVAITTRDVLLPQITEEIEERKVELEKQIEIVEKITVDTTAVEALETEVANLNDTIEEIKEAALRAGFEAAGVVAGLEENITAKNAEIADLNSDIADLTTELSEVIHEDGHHQTAVVSEHLDNTLLVFNADGSGQTYELLNGRELQDAYTLETELAAITHATDPLLTQISNLQNTNQFLENQRRIIHGQAVMLQMQRDQLQMQLDNLPTAAEVVAQYFMDNPVLDNNLNPDYTPRATTDNDVAAGVHSTGSGTVTTSLGISVNRDFVSTIGTSKVGFTNNNRQIVAEGGGFLSSGTDATISVIRSHIQALHAEIDIQYDQGYSDGYTAGYRDGFADGVASATN